MQGVELCWDVGIHTRPNVQVTEFLPIGHEYVLVQMPELQTCFNIVFRIAQSLRLVVNFMTTFFVVAHIVNLVKAVHKGLVLVAELNCWWDAKYPRTVFRDLNFIVTAPVKGRSLAQNTVSFKGNFWLLNLLYSSFLQVPFQDIMAFAFKQECLVNKHSFILSLEMLQVGYA